MSPVATIGRSKPPVMATVDTAAMTDQRLGASIRFVRIRRGWRQRDLAERAGVSQSAVSRIERGHLGEVTVDTIRRVAGALDMRIDVVGRWRGGDLDRLLASGHSALHESVARLLAGLSGWQFASEVSFSNYADRGVIDLLAWHEPTRCLLVIELKTEFVDMNELIGTLDRKFRNAAQIARERGWLASAASVSIWVIVVDSSTNRRRATEHATMLRHAYPLDGRAIRGWLRKPSGPVRCLSFWPNTRPGTGTAGPRPIRPARHRVRLASTHDAGGSGQLPRSSSRGKAP
jgi:transcriptional regulator with XRE-family HTH domain